MAIGLAVGLGKVERERESLAGSSCSNFTPALKAISARWLESKTFYPIVHWHGKDDLPLPLGLDRTSLREGLAREECGSVIRATL